MRAYSRRHRPRWQADVRMCPQLELLKVLFAFRAGSDPLESCGGFCSVDEIYCARVADFAEAPQRLDVLPDIVLRRPPRLNLYRGVVLPLAWNVNDEIRL